MTAVSPISVARKLLGCDGTPEHDAPDAHEAHPQTNTSWRQRESEGHVCVAHVRMRIFGFRFSVLVGLVIMKRKLRKLNKIQTNQYGIYLYMPISDIMQIPSLPSHTHTHTPTQWHIP